MREAPFISVITITLNDLAGLDYTVRTVERQTYGNYEHLVVDGLSSDGTIEFCVAAESRLPRFSYRSEKDRGIFDAMNKGARMAQGDLLVFVCSGDGLTDPSVLQYVADRWSESDTWQWGYGAQRYTDADQVPFAGTVQAPFNRRKLQLGRQHVPHPASYVSRDFFLANGGYDEAFGTAADQEFFVRASASSPPEVWIRFLADFMVGGIHSKETLWRREKLWHLMRVKNRVMVGNNRHVDQAYSMGFAAAESLRAKIVKRIMRSP